MITHTGTVYDGDVFDLEEAVNKAEFEADNVFEDVTLESDPFEEDADLRNDIDWIREHDDNV